MRLDGHVQHGEEKKRKVRCAVQELKGYDTDKARYDRPGDPMRLLFLLHSALLILMLSYPDSSYAQSFTVLSDKSPADSSPETGQESEYRPAREIRRFTEPRILLKGTAEEIGLDSRALPSALGTTFLQEFAFLQHDFAFDKTYETWEIGLFECEAWTVGRKYPIAFHVQCAGGSMDTPRHWQYAILGYGPKEKIMEIVKNALESVVAEYAAFVRKAHGKMESSPRPPE